LDKTQEKQDVGNELSKSEIMQQVLIMGDLGKLSSEERAAYYLRTCESLGLNPMTKPFDYIWLNGKLTLYARKDCTDQLRNIHGVSMSKPDIQFQDDLIIVTIEARDKTGRGDSDVGVVKRGDMQGNVANAIMKAVTKAKRRVTLSICGLGMLDETEVETISDAQPFSELTPVARGNAQAFHSRDSEWKAEMIALGKAAGELARDATVEVATEISIAQALAREVLRKNGSSTQAERTAAKSALQIAIAAAKEAPGEPA
jgi:hypothetical protein